MPFFKAFLLTRIFYQSQIINTYLLSKFAAVSSLNFGFCIVSQIAIEPDREN